MSSGYINLPAQGDAHWKAPVASAGLLPSLNNATGDARVDNSTQTVYVWDGSAWIAVATPGAAIAIDGLIGDVSASGPGVVTATINSGVIVNSMINASAAIALSKLAALTINRAIVSNGSGFLSAATTTATEIGYVNGVTSSIQTQLDGKQTTGNYITALTGNIVATGPGSVSATIQAGVIVNSMISASAAIAYSKLALTDSIVNADINSAAAIAYSKLALSNSIVNADINASAAIAYSKLALSNSIVNADINTAAAIAFSKMAALATNRAVITDGSGIVTVSPTTATEIGFVAGVTSAIQTQLNSKQTSGNYITALTGDVTASGPGSVAASLSANLKIASLTFLVDGGGATIVTGIKGDLLIPFACTITQVSLLADQTGSIVVDIWKDTYANYPPTVADSITASAKPTISSSNKSQDSTLTGWTTSIAAGDTLRFNVDSVTTIQRVTVSIRVTKT